MYKGLDLVKKKEFLELVILKTNNNIEAVNLINEEL